MTTKTSEKSFSRKGRPEIDTGEVERFSKLANEWWNPDGKFKPLHRFNPVRLE